MGRAKPAKQVGQAALWMAACLTLVLGLTACGGTDLPEDATGEVIYVQLCARCHGSDLRGGTGVALVGEEATSVGKPERYFVQSISSGIGRMPSFRNTLSEEQILRVSRYIMDQSGGG
ncbi:MAG: cytochrome c [bacterium]|nr:cytochrome c [bacterium]